MKVRGFEKVSTFEDINLPERATKHAAGYDFEAANDVVIPSIFKSGIATALKVALNKEEALLDEELLKQVKPTLVGTGVKAYMGDDEFLQLCNRSSNPLKNFLLLGNGVGIIDSDYYNNENNEGHIMFQFINFGLKDLTIKKGERIGQGIFLPFLKADGDESEKTRTGGFGSSGK
ncbi:dUTP diphosphatase [Vagococcus fluvialis]|uniref:dUTP diphosphatase n=1 Tax=Vagococcus fluvialis TaxID=2738 RepID=A0A369B679_9ENTE|nr:dUTP diphosphatase [Vagococcus fluvialis]MBO0443883.1 dUTP diphosphatase [Vagococcus fluvialis]MDT2746552.1 dUTP diphosphatase [Vagococcus fluvialis]RCX15184.1 deoxyuridine 5'-triphosphate nucleotidohydrolase [Vagococcus fluvialis]RSU05539.1 dUTP diphosphatase [Vagococcus fluvialis]UDM74840.1 dUTP diphosphatase [Vagococcus fluvialis]